MAMSTVGEQRSAVIPGFQTTITRPREVSVCLKSSEEGDREVERNPIPLVQTQGTNVYPMLRTVKI